MGSDDYARPAIIIFFNELKNKIKSSRGFNLRQASRTCLGLDEAELKG